MSLERHSVARTQFGRSLFVHFRFDTMLADPCDNHVLRGLELGKLRLRTHIAHAQGRWHVELARLGANGARSGVT